MDLKVLIFTVCPMCVSVPGVIGSFRVSERGSHHFKVEWTPPMEENGIIIGYRLGFVESKSEVIET